MRFRVATPRPVMPNGVLRSINESQLRMSISDSIAPRLPYLRRFARALSGSQAAGDSYVAATLEVLIEQPSLFDSALDPRVALYRTFVGLWNSVDINLKPELAAGPAMAVDRKLDSITPTSSAQAFYQGRHQPDQRLQEQDWIGYRSTIDTS